MNDAALWTLALTSSLTLSGCAEPPGASAPEPAARSLAAASPPLASPQATPTPAPKRRASSGYVWGDPVGWRQEIWWRYIRHEGTLSYVAYEVGE